MKDPRNRTSRERGVVGSNPLILRHLLKNAEFYRDKRILDYGAGKTARHVTVLKDNGFWNVSAFDILGNFNPAVHDQHALDRGVIYDIIYASNVLNVQESMQGVRWVICDIWMCLKPGGLALVNLPLEPRKGAWQYRKKMKGALSRKSREGDLERLLALIRGKFGTVQRVAGSKYGPVFQLSEPM